MIASECVTDRQIKKRVNEIVTPIFEKALIERARKLNQVLIKWL